MRDVIRSYDQYGEVIMHFDNDGEAYIEHMGISVRRNKSGSHKQYKYIAKAVVNGKTRYFYSNSAWDAFRQASGLAQRKEWKDAVKINRQELYDHYNNATYAGSRAERGLSNIVGNFRQNLSSAQVGIASKKYENTPLGQVEKTIQNVFGKAVSHIMLNTPFNWIDHNKYKEATKQWMEQRGFHFDIFGDYT